MYIVTPEIAHMVERRRGKQDIAGSNSNKPIFIILFIHVVSLGFFF